MLSTVVLTFSSNDGTYPSAIRKPPSQHVNQATVVFKRRRPTVPTGETNIDDHYPAAQVKTQHYYNEKTLPNRVTAIVTNHPERKNKKNKCNHGDAHVADPRYCHATQQRGGKRVELNTPSNRAGTIGKHFGMAYNADQKFPTSGFTLSGHNLGMHHGFVYGKQANKQAGRHLKVLAGGRLPTRPDVSEQSVGLVEPPPLQA